MWTQDNAILLKVQIGSVTVNAIVDTGSSGVVLSEACFQRLGLKEDKEVEFTINSATQTVKKLRKLIFKLPVKLGEVVTEVPALVLEGLHFNMLLENELDKRSESCCELL